MQRRKFINLLRRVLGGWILFLFFLDKFKDIYSASNYMLGTMGDSYRLGEK